jgi:hypothetical protein
MLIQGEAGLMGSDNRVAPPLEFPGMQAVAAMELKYAQETWLGNLATYKINFNPNQPSIDSLKHRLKSVG